MIDEKNQFHKTMVEEFIKPKILDMNSRASRLESEGNALLTKAATIRAEASSLESNLYSYMKSRAEQFPDD
jgi:hypothetical protein